MEGIKVFLEKFYVIPIIIIILHSVRLTINYTNASNLEKILMTEFQKVKINLSIIFTMSIVTVMIALPFTIDFSLNEFISETRGETQNEIDENHSKNNENASIDDIDSEENLNWLTYIIALFIILLIAFFPLIYTLFILVSFFRDLYLPKKRYFYEEGVCKETNQNIKWYIRRYNENWGLIVESSKGEQRVLNNFHDKKFKFEINKKGLIGEWVGNNLGTTLIIHLIVLFVTVITLFCILYSGTNSANILLILIFALFISSIMSLLVLISQYYEKIKNIVFNFKSNKIR